MFLFGGVIESEDLLMIVNQIHLVSTPLDMDYKNVYDGVSDKRALRTFLLNNFDNIFIANKSTKTSIRFEKEITLTLNIPISDAGGDTFYEDLRRFNYMIITAIQSKDFNLDYSVPFFYFVKNYSTENSVHNFPSSMPEGLTQKDGFLTVTFELVWDVWNNNIEAIQNETTPQHFIRKHIDGFVKSGNDMRFRNIYESNNSNVSSPLKSFSNTNFHNKGTEGYLVLYAKLIIATDNMANALEGFYKFNNDGTTSALPLFDVYGSSTVYTGCNVIYIPLLLVNAKNREPVQTGISYYVGSTHTTTFLGLSSPTSYGAYIRKMSPYIISIQYTYKHQNIYRAYKDSSDNLIVEFDGADDLLWFKSDGKNFFCFSTNEGYVTGTNTTTFTASYHVNYKFNTFSVDTKDIVTRIKFEPNCNCYPYKYKSMYNGADEIPLIPYFDENTLSVKRKNFGSGILYKILHSGEDKLYSSVGLLGNGAINTDYYQSMLAYNSVSMPYNLATSFLTGFYSMIKSNAKGQYIKTGEQAISTMNEMGNLLAKRGDAMFAPDTIKNESVLGLSNFQFLDEPVFFENDISAYDKEQVFYVLNMFGISFNRIASLENTRVNFDYNQTQNSSLPSVKDCEDRIKVEDIFNSGVRRWHINTGYINALLKFDVEYINQQLSLKEARNV